MMEHNRIVIQHLFNEKIYSAGLSEYLNAIPVCRYRDYCNVETMFIEIRTNSLKTIDALYYHNDKSIETITFDLSDNPIQVDTADLRAIVFDVSSEDLDKIDGGSVYVIPKHRTEIKLAHIVCTYHREEEVIRKMESFSSFENDNYHMIVVDNGRSLNYKPRDNVTIVPSPNYGGSSGFSRGMDIAVSNRFTHVLLNDDDAIISPESVFRLISFLELLNDDNREICISGVMFDSSDMTRVYSTGGYLKDNGIAPCSSGLDVAKREEMLQLFDEKNIKFSDWTLFCIPTVLVQKKGLPLPLFIWFDDVEFGYRLDAHIITVPGISVWHPSRFNRFSTSHRYYETRNRLVTLFVSKKVGRKRVDRIFESIAVDVASYRYKSAEESLRGVEDFLLGPDHLFSLCKEGMRESYPIELDNLESLREGMNFHEMPKRAFSVRKLTLNGLLLSSKGDVESSPFEMDTSKFYRAGKILYQYNTEKGFIVKRDLKKAIILSFRIIKMKRKVFRHFSELRKAYSDSIIKYSSQEFWRELWGFNDPVNL